MAKKFQNLSVDYKEMMNMSMSDRMAYAQSGNGPAFISSLTPQQYASLFPSFYRERLPDVGGFSKSMTSEGRNGASGGSTGSGSSPSARPSANRNRVIPEDAKRVKEATGIDYSDTEAKAELTKKQRELFDKLKSGKISADDPEVAFMKDMKDDDLKRAGIVRETSRDGKVQYGMTATKASQMTDEEVIKAASGVARPGTEGLQGQAFMKKSVYDSFVSAGFSDKQAKALTAEVGRENDFNAKYIYGSHAEPGGSAAVRGRTNTGMFSWGDPARRKAFLAHMGAEGQLDENGNILKTPEALAAQARFVKKELGQYKSGQEFLADPNVSQQDGGRMLARYIGWDIQGKTIDAGVHIGRRDRYYDDIDKINQDFPGLIPKDATPQQIAEARKKIEQKEYEDRQSKLAERLSPKLPEGVDPKFAEKFERFNNNQKQNTLVAIEKLGGVEKFNEKVKSSPDQVNQAIAGNIKQTNDHVMLNGYIQSRDENMNGGGPEECATLSKAFNKEAGVASTWKVQVDNSRIKPGVMLATTTYNDGSGGQRGGSYHTGIALTAPDRDGNFKMLDQWKGQPAKITNRNINEGYKGAQYGVVAGADKPSLTALNVAREMAAKNGDLATAEQLGQTVAQYQETIKKESDEKAKFSQGASEAQPTGGIVRMNPENQENLQNSPEAKPRDSTPREPRQKPAEQPAPEQREQPKPAEQPKTDQEQGQQPVVRQRVSETNTAPSLKVAEAAPEQKPVREAANKEEDEKEPTAKPVQVAATGGEIKTPGDKITAYPIGALKGDNSVVVDSNKEPLFTMNTEKETAVYNPRTNNVSVSPVQNGAAPIPGQPQPQASGVPVLADGGTVDLKNVPKTDPDSLEPPMQAPMSEAATSSEPEQVNQTTMVSSSASDNSFTDSWQRAVQNLSANPMPCPSFARATASSRFMRDNDYLGGHFDDGSKNLK